MADDYAGEGDASFLEFMREAASQLPDSSKWTSEITGGPSAPSGGYDANTATRRSEYTSEPYKEAGFFENLLSKSADGISKSWDKDPLAFLKVGVGAIGGAYSDSQREKAAATLAQSHLDQQNNADALKQAENARYNGSFSTQARKPTNASKTLKRFNGTEIYGNTGNIKG